MGEQHIRPLSDVCTLITDGTHSPPKFVNEGIPFLLVSNITGNVITYDTTKFITEETYNELMKRTPVEVGDVLLSTVGSYGHPALVEDSTKFSFQRHIAHLKPNRELLDSRFLHAAILAPDSQQQIEKLVLGVAQKTLNLSAIKRIRIPVPSIDVQKVFVRLVQQSDKSKYNASQVMRLIAQRKTKRKGVILLTRKDNTFAAYLKDKYYDLIFSRLKSYIYQNRSRLNLHTSLVPDPNYVKLDDFHVMGVSFKETEDDRILFRAAIQADVVVKGRSRRDYEEDIVSPWFSISFTGILRCGLNMVTILSVAEYSKEYFSKEDALSQYLVPYVYSKDLDLHAEKFLRKYCPRALDTPMPLPVKEVLEAMCLTVHLAPLPEGIFGRTYFNNATVDIYDQDRNIVSADIEEGTILVDPDVFFMRNIGSANNTIIHECVHWDKHYKFFELQKLINPELTSISCAVVEEYKKGSGGLAEELAWMEWQANAIAPKILIPARTGRAKLNEILNTLTQAFTSNSRASIMELAISEFADFFKVSTMAAKIRAIELGFDQAAGVFNYVDGQYYPPFSFAKGSLKKNQTFIIDRNNAIFESFFNKDLAEDFKAGRFIHAGGMMVINDPKYVSVQDERAELTEYALAHVDECCLVFDRTTRVSNHYDDSFYRICFLCRDADSKSFVEAKFNPKEGKNEDVQKRAREMAAIAAEAKRVSDILAEEPSSFCGTLDYHIKRRGYTNEKMEERTGISSRMIQDYRNRKDSKPTLQSVLALCIGLNLQPAFSYDLISKAGHNIMIPSEEYLIYRYLIDNHHMENIYMWNSKLQDAGIPQQLPKKGNKLTVPAK